MLVTTGRPAIVYATWMALLLGDPLPAFATDQDREDAHKAIEDFAKYGKNTLLGMINQLYRFEQFGCNIAGETNPILLIGNSGFPKKGIPSPKDGLIVYIDVDPTVEAIAQQTLTRNQRFICANMWHPDIIVPTLKLPPFAGKYPPNTPIALILIGVLDFLDDNQVVEFLTMWYNFLPVGSTIVLSLTAYEGLTTFAREIEAKALVEKHPGFTRGAKEYVYVRPLHDEKNWKYLLGPWAEKYEDVLLAPTPLSDLPGIAFVPGMIQMRTTFIGIIARKG